MRNSGNETKEFPASLTDEAIAPGADKIVKESQPMHSHLEVLKGSDVVVNLSAELRTHKVPCRGKIPRVAFFRQVELSYNNPSDCDFRRAEPRQRV